MGNCIRNSRRNPSQSIPGSSFSRTVHHDHHDQDKLNHDDQLAADHQNSQASNKGRSLMKPGLKIFTLAELKAATREFRGNTFLGEVFKGWIDEKTYTPTTTDGVGMAVAVKKSKFPYSYQDPKEGKAEVKTLAQLSHPNLVKLVGFYCEDEQFLLLYEYMPKGSLDKHLFMRGSVEVISWDIRLKIAIGAARGLAFLHNSEKSVIYRDFKASNILLDEILGWQSLAQ